MTIKTKFRTMVVVAAAGLLVLAGFWIRNQRADLMKERQQKTRHLVEVPYSVLTQAYKLESEGKLSRVDAQARAIETIRALRYDTDNYFWINDEHPTMIMHPVRADLNGKDLSAMKDPTGKAFFVEFVHAAANKSDGDFVLYQWPKPKDPAKKPVPKLSYVKKFGPWGWIVGTGIYVDDVDAAWWSSALTAGGLTLLCLVPLLAVSFSTSRSILRRLHDMVDRVKDVAEGEGDLTKRIEITSNDEVAELGRWFNKFMDELHQILSQVASNTESLASAGREIAETTRGHAEGLESQRDQTNQVATAMQEMSSTVQQVSENSQAAATASARASETAQQGGKIVEETLTRMRAIAESVGSSAQQIQELGKRSDQIGQIIGVIDDIADQTNLLALNAAIEAARAGEQGRGFAVVADEVRKLAERTSTATKEIAEMIRSIQSETKNAVSAMQAGTAEVERGVESTTMAGSALHEIIQTNERVGNMITQIATAATEQSAATEEINSSIEKIRQIAGHSASAMQDTQTSLEDLSVLAQNLKQVVGRFRLSLEDSCEKAGASGDPRNAVTTTLDFSRVKMAHRSWKLRLRRFLNGDEALDSSKLCSHRDCELGKWIYAVGVPRHGEFQEMQMLEARHKEMHGLITGVIDFHRSGRLPEAEAQLAKVNETAEQVVGFLDALERRLKQPMTRAASA